MEPRASRPRRALLLAIAPLLREDRYLGMTEAEFVAEVMRATGGSNAPTTVADEYRKLMHEAGIPQPHLTFPPN